MASALASVRQVWQEAGAMRLFVGQASLRGSFRQYCERFSLLELRAEPGTLPKLESLKQWRSAAPQGFAFAVTLPRSVARLDRSEAAARDLDYAVQVQRVLSATWFVVRTEARVVPSSRNKEGLAALHSELARTGVRVAWEPTGVWEEAEAERFAVSIGMHVVRDLSRSPAPEGSVVYTRVRAIGSGGRVALGAPELLAERLWDKELAFVVLEGDGAARAAAALGRAVANQTEEER